MSRKNQKGFTIIEVILFLALSGLFLTVAFNGISSKNAAVQFTDSMRSLQSTLQAQYSQLVNGVNTASALPTDCAPGDINSVGGSGNCILIGKVVEFTDGQMITTDLFGDFLDLETFDGGDVELISTARPRPTGVVESDELRWGTTFTDKAENYDPEPISELNRLGLLRSPRSTRIVPIVFSKEADINGDVSNSYAAGHPQTAIDEVVNAYFCFEGANGQFAAITFGSEAGNAKIDVEFDKLECQP